MKLTRFLIADNPMVEGATSAIIHTIDPQAIIEIIEGHVVCESLYRHYTYEDEEYTLNAHFIFTTNFDADQHHLITTKLLERAWHWFVAYMKLEDEQEIY